MRQRRSQCASSSARQTQPAEQQPAEQVFISEASASADAEYGARMLWRRTRIVPRSAICAGGVRHRPEADASLMKARCAGYSSKGDARCKSLSRTSADAADAAV